MCMQDAYVRHVSDCVIPFCFFAGINLAPRPSLLRDGENDVPTHTHTHTHAHLLFVHLRFVQMMRVRDLRISNDTPVTTRFDIPCGILLRFCYSTVYYSRIARTFRHLLAHIDALLLRLIFTNRAIYDVIQIYLQLMNVA